VEWKGPVIELRALRVDRLDGFEEFAQRDAIPDATRNIHEENSSEWTGLGAIGNCAVVQAKFIVRRRAGCAGRQSNQRF